MSFKLCIFVGVGVLAQFTQAIPLSSSNNITETPTRIIGGSDAQLGSSPHMVGLIFNDIVPYLICGGSIVSQRHVLTAAHCVEAFLMWDGSLYPGLHGVIGTVKYDSLNNIIKFSDHIIHPNYDRINIKNDIGVLTTVGRIELSKYVSIVPLDFDWIDNEECIATGWGLTYTDPPTNHLQKLTVNTLTPEECQKIMTDNNMDWTRTPPINPEIEICTYHSIGKGMCNGDSGSALVSTRTGKQIGIVSWGFPCARGLPDIFVRISGFKGFLLDVLKHENRI